MDGPVYTYLHAHLAQMRGRVFRTRRYQLASRASQTKHINYMVALASQYIASGFLKRALNVVLPKGMVDTWSVAHAVLVVCVCGGQVAVLKHLFKSSGGSQKTRTRA